MRNMVSYQQICAPNHVQVQLPVGVLNGLLGSVYIQTVIDNTINSWYYVSLLWIKIPADSLLYDISFVAYTFSWTILDGVLENVIDTTKNVLNILFLYLFLYTSLSNPFLTKNFHTCHQQDSFNFILQFFFAFESIYLKYLKFLQSGPNSSLGSKTICDHIFSDPKSYYNLHISVTSLAYIFFSCMCQSSTYF